MLVSCWSLRKTLGKPGKYQAERHLQNTDYSRRGGSVFVVNIAVFWTFALKAALDAWALQYMCLCCSPLLVVVIDSRASWSHEVWYWMFGFRRDICSLLSVLESFHNYSLNENCISNLMHPSQFGILKCARLFSFMSVPSSFHVWCEKADTLWPLALRSIELFHEKLVAQACWYVSVTRKVDAPAMPQAKDLLLIGSVTVPAQELTGIPKCICFWWEQPVLLVAVLTVFIGRRGFCYQKYCRSVAEAGWTWYWLA